MRVMLGDEFTLLSPLFEILNLDDVFLPFVCRVFAFCCLCVYINRRLFTFVRVCVF